MKKVVAYMVIEATMIEEFEWMKVLYAQAVVKYED